MNCNDFQAQIRMTRRMADGALKGISEEDRARQPAGIVNHAGWSVPHLCIAMQRAATMLGCAQSIPEDWFTRFGNGSKPTPHSSDYPTLAESRAMMNRLLDQISAAYESADATLLASTNPLERMREMLPTLGETVTFMTITHASYHLGEIAAWKKALLAGE